MVIEEIVIVEVVVGVLGEDQMARGARLKLASAWRVNPTFPCRGSHGGSRL
jgi:hypothetical protein